MFMKLEILPGSFAYYEGTPEELLSHCNEVEATGDMVDVEGSAEELSSFWRQFITGLDRDDSSSKESETELSAVQG